MAPRRWTLLAVACFLVSAACAVGAFTRFADEPDRGTTAEDAQHYNRARYGQARVAVVLGIAAAFALLGGLACLQKSRSRALL